MNKVRKICVVTGTRAEYGLLFWLMKEIKDDNNLKLQIIVTGMHLSHEFGLTYEQIEEDGFVIDSKVEMLLSSDSAVGIGKSIGLGVIGFSDVLADLKPDLLLVLGDRFEIFSAVSAATVAKIPIAHLSGGETTEGAFDEAFRHSITKMSHFHFTTTNKYRDRVIQLGEQEDRVFNVGAFGIDNINKLKLLSKDDFEESINFKLARRNLLITFHPATLDNSVSKKYIKNLLQVLDQLIDTHLIFTKANADNEGRMINYEIDKFVSKYADKAIVFTSLGQLRYLSAMQYVDAVVGNSSSGLVEAPNFNIGTINIGDRQRGRICAESVINCDGNKENIQEAFELLYSNSFQDKLQYITNPFDKGGATRKTLEIIRSVSLDGVLKKKFYDIN
ncbi:UDP-N-acetylglucosamine 2-epimerase (hydrolyzing) [bacterium]|jgi:GDP/UDP-N,N'-diacetylbacillosamine 2-epimerase (hydrolysing)|nr:UDP-N-acetylglucosamine 2-epimerase (hydrolyzing) [bacterium]